MHLTKHFTSLSDLLGDPLKKGRKEEAGQRGVVMSPLAGTLMNIPMLALKKITNS